MRMGGMNAVEWSETEREAVERGLRRYGFNVVAASIARQVLDDLAPFVAAREREAAAKALREAADKDAEVVSVHAGGGNLPVGLRVVTVVRLRDRADRIEREGQQ